MPSTGGHAQIFLYEPSRKYLNRIIAFASTALPVKVLKVVPPNCMTVNFTPGSGVATWNRNGAAAVILI